MTGVKKIENGKKSVAILIDYIKEIYKTHPDILKEAMDIDTLKMSSFKIALINSDYNRPVNLGNPDEYNMLEFAKLVKHRVGSYSEIIFKDLPADDPKKRCPDISLAKEILDWKPKILLVVTCWRISQLNNYQVPTEIHQTQIFRLSSASLIFVEIASDERGIKRV